MRAKTLPARLFGYALPVACLIRSAAWAADPAAAPPPPAVAPPTLSPAAAVGRALFGDVALSASGRQSCASCHSPAAAFSAPNAAPTQFGGGSLTLQGLRNSPSIAYASLTPPFTLNTAPPPPGRPPRAVGGLMLDGRVATLAAQAQLPFITAFEMGNQNAAEVTQRLKQRPYLAQFSQVYGAATLNNPDATLRAMGQAIAAFEVESVGFHPFTSKYDAYLVGQATLSANEAAGLKLFTDPNKGRCAACHSAAPVNGQPALFTDRSYHAIGVPRNWAIAYNNDSTALPAFVPANGASLGAPGHNYYDMGLCGPVRTDLSARTDLCGLFKVPTLRNVALKATYFHNGVFNNLPDVLAFYTTRNSNPARWYKQADGSPDQLYNDLPKAYAQNVEPRGANISLIPSLNPAEIKQVISFLCTLTDGFDPKHPAAYSNPAQCQAANQ